MRREMSELNETRKPLSTAAKTTTTMARSLISSPPRPQSSHGKERRDPSITPRRFGRFFTPRSRVGDRPPSASSRALRDLTASALNRCQTPSSPLKPVSEEKDVNNVFDTPPSRALKRRKTQHHSETALLPLSPPNSSPARPDMQVSPSRRRQLLSPIRSLPATRSSQAATDDDDMDVDEDEELPSMPAPVIKRTITLPSRGMAAQLVTRMTGGFPRGGHQILRAPVGDWRTETADFYSRPEDVHTCASNEGPGPCIPFSVTSCNTNSLVAVGDEEGYIRLLDSNEEFHKVHLAFPAHDNAIIDLTFSDDDRYIATASGDQSGKVIEMESQTTVSVLANHTASVKQVRFQPGQNNCTVLATSSRDGSIQFWDLRCSNGVRPVQEITGRPQGLEFRVPPNPNSGCVRTSIYDAHGRPPLHRYQTRQNPNLHLTSLPSPAAMSSDIGSRSEVPGRIGDVSVTAIQFLPQGQEHLLLSASEADSTVKLWDLRHVQQSAKSARNAYPVPVSYTRQPDSHLSFRPFGISALAMSGDGSRFYTLCKDNTVYAYSTSHLIAGQAPELGLRAGLEAPRRGRTQAHVGLGPLYGFRHPSFLATSFYIKAAVRPARDGRPEMLAVGSMDACPVLFPTDERYFRRDLGAGPGAPLSGVVDDRSSAVAMISPGGGGGGGSGARPGMLTRTNSVGGGFSARLNDTVPVYKPYGTALVRGHEKEVGPLAWTHDGKLVTVADDYTVRCWGENREKATDLRRGGEVNGRRWGCGWADVGENWDGDEDDW